MGIDPGLRRTGFGVIEAAGSRLRYLASGVIAVPVEAPMGERLRTILDSVGELVRSFAPAACAIERVFVNANAQSSLLLAQARGVAIAALASAHVTIDEYPPTTIKQAVTGNGRADKAQVQAMVQRLLALPGVPSPDAADALACAIAHAHARALVSALAGGRAAAGTWGRPCRRGRHRRDRPGAPSSGTTA